MCTSERAYNFFRQKSLVLNKKKKEMFKKRRKTVPLFSEKSLKIADVRELLR